MITKEQLQAMSDFDVNKALAKRVCKTHITHSNGGGGIVCTDGERVDYCNTPNDIMPLAFGHKLSLMPVITDDWEWQALKNNMLGISHYFNDKNPLRAIACCLILVLQDGGV